MICVSYFDAIERHSKFVSPSGDGFVDVYELRKNVKTGEDDLIKTGRKNLYEEIQAFKESSEIANILNRFINGETDILKQVDGFYGDVTSAPTSYADYFNKVKEAKKIFEGLPEEIRNKFDNDPEKFFIEFGTDSFIDKVNPVDNVTESEEIVNVEQ